MVPLRPLPRPPAAWRALCREAAAGGASAPRHALAWRQHRVPDVEGAAGAPYPLVWSAPHPRPRTAGPPSIVADAVWSHPEPPITLVLPHLAPRPSMPVGAITRRQMSVSEACPQHTEKSAGVPNAGHRCQLTSLPACRRFLAAAINVWLAALFRALPPAMAAARLQPVSGAAATP
jgi:hypothetical protein